MPNPPRLTTTPLPKPTFLSLFSGVGGLDLGLERAGWQCVAQVEIDLFCRRVLAKHWPDVPRFKDVRTVTCEMLPSGINLIAGGFPCQDVSFAGKRAGIEAPRSGLWFQFHRLIRELRPLLVLVENTAGLLDRGLDRVLGTLAEIGFDAEWFVLSACAFGAPHPRERVFVVAYPEGERPGQLRRLKCPDESQAAGHLHWAKAEPECERVVDGVPERLERLTACGNAVSPIVAEWIGHRLMEAYRRECAA